MAKSCRSTKSHLCSKHAYFQQSYTVIGKSQCSRIVYASPKSRNLQQSYTLLGESAKFQSERFGMNVIVSAPKLSRAEHQSPSDVQMACLLIGPEVSFRMAHSQRSLGACHSTWPIQDALFGRLGSLRRTDG